MTTPRKIPSAFRIHLVIAIQLLVLAGALFFITNSAEAAPSTTLVVNEIDYDQPSTDTAEFIELKNVSAATTNLDNYTVELVNGNGGAIYPPTVNLPSVDLAAGDYYVICANAAVVSNCDLDVNPDTNLIQNGAPDGVAIRESGTLVDAVSYEGDMVAPYTEGSGAGLDDDAGTAGKSISRCADGEDSDQNNVDFSYVNATPGAVNDCPVVIPDVPINEIQGATHTSPLAGDLVTTNGVVTAVGSNGFYLQTPDAMVDVDDATSEAIFVFTGSAPTVSVGDDVDVEGTVTEFRPGGSFTNLTITELVSPSVTVNSSGNALPTTSVIGTGGRIPPSEVIDDDATGSVETSGTFDADTDGIDFYESLEGMLVQVNNPVATGPTNNFGEISVLADNGIGAGVRTARGGIAVRPGDFNPERIIVDDGLASTPEVNTGDNFTGPAIGVLSYSFGNFKLNVTSSLVGVDNGLVAETVAPTKPGELAAASFNVENLDANDSQDKFDRLAAQIVDNLASPDVIALDEVQDDNGPINDSVTSPNATLARLTAAITAAGGPSYDFRQIDPVDDQDGGEPGGNIRVAFLYKSSGTLSFVDRPGGGASVATTVNDVGGAPELSASPGRIDPTDSAFDSSRKPLVGEFEVGGRKLFLIANHWNSKGGDDPLFGRDQPAVLSSETQRVQQAQLVNDFVDELLAVDPSAAVMVLGDLNDFGFSAPLATLKGSVLTNLADELPEAERYSYVYDGNSQQLDHALASNAIADELTADIVHTNSEFADQASDHDPVRATFCADSEAPELSVSLSRKYLLLPNHRYVPVTASVAATDDADPDPTVELVSVVSDEPDDAPGLWDGRTTNDIVIVGDRSFDLRAERDLRRDGRFYTVTYRATDACGNTATKSAHVKVPLIPLLPWL